MFAHCTVLTSKTSPQHAYTSFRAQNWECSASILGKLWWKIREWCKYTSRCFLKIDGILGNNKCRVNFNITLVDATLHQNVAPVSPCGSPWVTNNPVIFTIESTIANDNNTMVHAQVIASGVVINTTPIETNNLIEKEKIINYVNSTMNTGKVTDSY